MVTLFVNDPSHKQTVVPVVWQTFCFRLRELSSFLQLPPIDLNTWRCTIILMIYNLSKKSKILVAFFVSNLFGCKIFD